MFLSLQNIYFRTEAIHSAYACAAFDSNHGVGYSKLSCIEHLTCVPIKSWNYPKSGKWLITKNVNFSNLKKQSINENQII